MSYTFTHNKPITILPDSINDDTVTDREEAVNFMNQTEHLIHAILHVIFTLF